MSIKIRCWIDGDPPYPFNLGPAPTDYGCGRAAYTYKDGKLERTIYRGSYWLEFPDGTIVELGTFKQFYSSEVLTLLRLAAAFGIEETPESIADLERRNRSKLSELQKLSSDKVKLEEKITKLEKELGRL